MVPTPVAFDCPVVTVGAMKRKYTKTLVIDRARWLNGEYVKRVQAVAPGTCPTSGLREPSENNRMCCLGFYALSCRVPARELEGILYPAGLSADMRAKLHPSIACIYTNVHTARARRLATLNDDTTIGAKSREKRIAAEFAKIGVKVKYKGRYPSLAQIRKEIARRK